MADGGEHRHQGLRPALLLVLVVLLSPDVPAARAAASVVDQGCAQVAGEIHDARQEDTFTWALNVASAPAHLDPERVARAVVRATDTVARGVSPCVGAPGPDVPAVTPPGLTQRHANVTPEGLCFPDATSDGISVVSFGDLPGGVVSVSCTYADDGDIWQADVMLNDDPGLFTTEPRRPTCTTAYDLQAVVTHERGHSFGLADVAEGPRTDDLTMSAFIGRCDLSARTLGRGELDALARLYPAWRIPATALSVSAATSETTATPPSR